MIKFRTLIALLVVLLNATPAVSLEDQDIVVSVKPLHSLVANITKGISKPVLVLTTAASPHTYTLKPSNVAALAKAKLIFWMGPQLETFLQKPLASLNAKVTIISFQGFEMVTDPHIWLDPQQAEKMVTKIATQLTIRFPENSALFQNNLRATLTQLAELDQDLKRQLSGIKPFMVFHNAYGQLAKRYDLKIMGALVTNPELPPGAKRIREMRKILKSSNTQCIFSEAQFDQRMIRIIIEGTTVKVGTLDPMGSNLNPGPELYFKLMKQIADNLELCG